MLRETIAEVAAMRWSPRELRRSAFYAEALARLLAMSAQYEGVRLLVLPDDGFVPSEAEMLAARKRALALIEHDWANVEAGIYPAAIAHGFSWVEFAKAWPGLVRDMPKWRARARRRDHAIAPAGAEGFPAYYRRTFHWQTGGYLEAGSAERYDAQVEILFGGLADAMRRQVLPPIVRFVRSREGASLKILDLACGTGGVLRMLATTLPGVRLWGLDLSPHYVAHARRRLADVLHLSLVVENAERTPFAEGTFDAITNVYLAHELPSDARHRVFHEAFRILAPGGLFVFADSVRPSDTPELARFLDAFPRQFHEPYFRSYQRDDLESRLREAGFVLEAAETHFLTKVLVARKPASTV